MIGFLLLGELIFTREETLIVHFFQPLSTHQPDEPNTFERGGEVKERSMADARRLMVEVFVKRIEVKGSLKGQPVRLITNEWYKAAQLAETYWLYVVWDPLGDSPEVMRIHNPVAKLDHAKREIVAARFYEIPAEALQNAVVYNP